MRKHLLEANMKILLLGASACSETLPCHTAAYQTLLNEQR
jgi:hypothetical protein